MQYQVPNDEGMTRNYSLSATRIASFSLALAIVIGLLPIAKASRFDIRSCAALSSAWLNVFTVALASRLPEMSSALAQHCAPVSHGVHVRSPDWRRRFGTALRVSLRSVHWQPWAVLACAVVSTLFAWLAWRPVLILMAATPLLHGTALVVLLGTCLLAFGTLFAELFFSMHAHRGRAWASLPNVLRAALLSALVVAACAGLLSYASIFTVWPVQAVAAFNAAIALEFALRAIFSWFGPPPGREGESSVPDSLVASLLRLHPSPFARFATQLRYRYGIDLRQNWVLQSVVRVLPAAIVAIGASAWLLTGVAMLGPDQRAVYERFGAPVAVWQPGLHFTLPWPFGKIRTIENGAVHQLVISGTPADGTGAAPLIHSDAQTPAQLDRLWDVAHQGETSQVIAGASGDRQNFQIVSADVRLDYRIGLSDFAARASLYQTADVRGTLRAIANREVVRYLASHTLDSLLETRQTAMADSIRGAVQAQLGEVSSGVDVVAVVIESVHPPAGASVAWHAIQAAQIRAEASVAQEHGLAAEALGDALQRAHTVVARADAQAADITSAARVQEISFSADNVAAQGAGPAFVLEYYLHNLQNGLQNAHITVIDDRLVEGNRATVDLRPIGAVDASGAKHTD
jgi:regulator of protease activity HflC (stomatin/prohibitin superfamily)